MNGLWCQNGDPNKWNVWKVAGDHIETQHPNSTGNYSFEITGPKAFTIKNLFDEQYTIMDASTMHLSSFMKNTDLMRCGQ